MYGTRSVAPNGNLIIDGNPFPQAPEYIASVTARYGVPVGDTGEFFIFTDWAFQGETNFFIYDAVEFKSDDNFERPEDRLLNERRTIRDRCLRSASRRRERQGRHRLQQPDGLRQRTARVRVSFGRGSTEPEVSARPGGRA